MKEMLTIIFNLLDQQIKIENNDRLKNGSLLISHSRIEILGQTSLLIQPELTYGLTLAQTGDLDAQLRADYFVKQTLKKILPKFGFIYDEDSPLNLFLKKVVFYRF
jgi:hypothetical protein